MGHRLDALGIWLAELLDVGDHLAKLAGENVDFLLAEPQPGQQGNALDFFARENHEDSKVVRSNGTRSAGFNPSARDDRLKAAYGLSLLLARGGLGLGGVGRQAETLRMHWVQTRIRVLVPPAVVMRTRWRFGLNSRRLMPVTFVPTPPRYLARPRVRTWLPICTCLPQISHERAIEAILSELFEHAARAEKCKYIETAPGRNPDSDWDSDWSSPT
jgi:hypothetical protein